MVKNQSILLLLIVSGFLTSQLVIGQDKTDPKEWFVEAESYFLFEEYKDALPLYQRILKLEPENYNVKTKIGVCYLNDIYQHAKSISYLEEAVEHISFQYKQNNFKEKMAPPEAQYYLGKAYHINNMFNKAIETYQRFLNFASPDEFDLDMVKAEIEACQLAKKICSKNVFFSPKNLGSVINSRFEDVNPVLSGDGKVLAFTRRLQFYDGVFVSVKNEKGGWTEPVNLTGDFEVDGNSYTTGISYFGDELFVYRSDNYDGNIYSSMRISEKWSRLEKLNENINTKYWESHASPSHDGQYLIFTSNREGGYGGLDIYRSKRSSGGNWGTASNLGPVVNSPANEDTPFLSNEGYSLFFSSQGHNTIGGYDIFMSTLRSDGTWSVPYNMGYPLNTTSDNLFYYPTGIDAFGLYSFYKEGSTEGMLDIYEVEVYNERIPRIFTVSGKIHIDGKEDESLSKLKVKLLRSESKELTGQGKIDSDGNFSIDGEQGEYTLVVEGPGVETYQKNVTLDLNQPSAVLTLSDIALTHTGQAYQPVAVAEKKAAPEIDIKADYFTVTDSLAIPIELIVPKGSDLKVLIYVNDQLVGEENIPDVKKRFTYFYKPKPGENILKFIVTDPEGNIAEKEVTVTYFIPPVPVAGISVPDQSKTTAYKNKQGDFFKEVASDSLSIYLNKLELSNYSDLYALYEHLKAEAARNNFTLAQIEAMFAIYYTQQDKINWHKDFSRYGILPDSVSDGILDSVSMPFEFLARLRGENLVQEHDLRKTLFEMVHTQDQTEEDMYRLLTSFSRTGSEAREGDMLASMDQVWILLSSDLGEDEAFDMLQIAATTDDLDFFYQNLLVSSEGNLHQYIADMNLESLTIHNSISLAEHLFRNASDKTYTVAELMQAMDAARLNRSSNLARFQYLLAQDAEGALKSQILLSSEKMNNNASYEDLLNYLLNQSKHKDYSRESVYDLLLKLIGIKDVDEFAEKLISYGYSDINNAIADTSLNHFSNPLELVQYLISVTQLYDFTASDINNMLIRMILERGLDDKAGEIYEDELGHKFWKSRRFIATVILVNIGLLILIILFRIRKKRTDQK